MLPQAKTVSSRITPIRRNDLVMDVLRSLKEHGVAVLVDESERPFDVLTSCDIERVKRKVAELKLTGNSPAPTLFSEKGREVYTVKDNDDLEIVAQRLARFGLGTGIVVVDASGRYAGYVFNAELRNAADQYSQRVEADVRRVEAQYPEAWSSLRRSSS